MLVLLTNRQPVAQDAGVFHADYDKLPTITLDATGAPIERVLKELASRLNFEISYAGSVDKSSTVTGKFQGEVTDILPRVLRGMDYVVVYDGSKIQRVVVTSAKATAQGTPIPTTAPSGTPVGQPNVPEAGPAPTPRPGIAAAPPRPTPGIGSAAAAAAASVAGLSPPSAPGGLSANAGHSAPLSPLDTLAGSGMNGDTSAPAEGNPVSSLLQSQANLLRPNIGAPPPDPANGESSSVSPSGPSADELQQSLAATTQKAQENLRALMEALKAACIGNNCPK